MTIGVADMEIKAASANASPGSPGDMVMIKGTDIYFPFGEPVEGVQHYVKQKVVYDPEIGYGAEWVGDYILGSDGQFVEVTE